MSDFSGTTFAAGSVTGLRAFIVHDEHLDSPQQQHKWVPGENKAHCGITMLDHRHHVGGMGCTCGFYAYYDGSNEYLHGGRVAGVVEGYGHVTYGNRGFRAEKAKVVALCHTGSRGAFDRPMQFVFMGWGLYWVVTSVMWFVSGKPANGVLGIVMLVLILGVSSFLVTGAGGLVHYRTLKQIAKNYDVPLYRTQAAMLKKHPLTKFDELPE